MVEQWFVRRDETAFPVFQGDRFAGVVTMDDVHKVPRDEWDVRTVREIMISAEAVPSAVPSAPVLDALRKMGAADVKVLPISDFKTNEYAKLIGGASFEPAEENPMLGWRGASRCYHPGYKEGFLLEVAAVRRSARRSESSKSRPAMRHDRLEIKVRSPALE
ncbi:MAG: phosphoenolpyruvate synthase [Labilithrix sp.]|nr:phosphoenolpyruvate synthase [Labilithrix sp.]